MVYEVEQKSVIGNDSVFEVFVCSVTEMLPSHATQFIVNLSNAIVKLM